MSAKAPQRQELNHRIGEVRAKMGTVLRNTEYPRLRELWAEWEKRLDQIVVKSREDPKVSIALVGGVGAGKSTLINALIEADLLPVSTYRACTSAVTDVSYSQGPGYEAIIEFITYPDLIREIEALRGDIADTANFSTDTAEPLIERQNIRTLSQAARDKLATLYRLEDSSAISGIDFYGPGMPVEVTLALDEETRTIRAANLPDLSNSLVDYLSSDGSLWPIVRSVRIRGPFAALQGGTSLVDLPGLNDPNEARERVTREYLKSSRFIWVVFDIKRGLTRDLFDFLESSDLVRQLVMDGRVEALTFVATSSDNISRQAAVREYNLNRDATRLDAIQARNSVVRPAVARQLEDLALSIAETSGEDASRSDQLARRLKAASVFTSSAREYLRLTGVVEDESVGVDDVEHTEVPALRDHLKEISSRYDTTALLIQLHGQIDTLLAEIGSEVDAQIVRLSGQIEATQQQKEEVEAALDRAGAFLQPRLTELEERLVSDLEAARKLLAERLKRGVESGQAELDNSLRAIGFMHWASLRAMARRDGHYVGSLGEFDCSAKIAEPVRNSITLPYADFFSDHLANKLEAWTDRLRGVADDHRRELLDTLGNVATTASTLRTDLGRFAKGAGKVLQEQLAQIRTEVDQKIRDVQQNLHGSIVEQVRANMLNAYRESALVTGKGTKARMLGIISKHARQVSVVMFRDAEQAVLQGVGSLNNWISGQSAKMTATVALHAAKAAENLRLDTSQAAPHDELAGRRDSLRHLGKVVSALEQRSR
jgi:GTPase SAR1 family protein